MKKATRDQLRDKPPPGYLHPHRSVHGDLTPPPWQWVDTHLPDGEDKWEWGQSRAAAVAYDMELQKKAERLRRKGRYRADVRLRRDATLFDERCGF